MNKLHLTKKYFASLWQLSKLAMDDFYIEISFKLQIRAKNVNEKKEHLNCEKKLLVIKSYMAKLETKVLHREVDTLILIHARSSP